MVNKALREQLKLELQIESMLEGKMPEKGEYRSEAIEGRVPSASALWGGIVPLQESKDSEAHVFGA